MSVATVQKVGIGTWCRVTGFVPGRETVFHFVPESEVNYYKHRIAPRGPLSALMGAKAGDKVVAEFTDEELELTVLEVGRDRIGPVPNR